MLAESFRPVFCRSLAALLAAGSLVALSACHRGGGIGVGSPGAPVINTFVSVVQAGNYDQLHLMFYAGLIVVVAGAVTVLVFAPKPAPHAAPHSGPEPTPQPAEA